VAVVRVLLLALALAGCDDKSTIASPSSPSCFSHVTIVGHSAGTPNEAWCGPGQKMTTTLTGETMFVVCECVDGGIKP
jgi:hypothetical protein